MIWNAQWMETDRLLLSMAGVQGLRIGSSLFFAAMLVGLLHMSLTKSHFYVRAAPSRAAPIPPPRGVMPS
jgi:hypothetical protein